MLDIILVQDSITLGKLKELAKQRYGDMLKAVVDIATGIIALGGEMRSDEEEVLLENGSEQKDLWGINIFVDLPRDEGIEFDSIQSKIITLINRIIK